jgi:hypothetical protein
LVVDLKILHLQIILLILLSGDAFTAVADFTEGIVEVAAVEADPIRVGITFGVGLRVGLLHEWK